MDDENSGNSNSGPKTKAGETEGKAVDPAAADAAEMAEAKRTRAWTEIGSGAFVVVDYHHLNDAKPLGDGRGRPKRVDLFQLVRALAHIGIAKGLMPSAEPRSKMWKMVWEAINDRTAGRRGDGGRWEEVPKQNLDNARADGLGPKAGFASASAVRTVLRRVLAEPEFQKLRAKAADPDGDSVDLK